MLTSALAAHCQVKCSMDGKNWEKIGSSKDFRGLNFHNDEFVPVSGTCLKIKLKFESRKQPGAGL